MSKKAIEVWPNRKEGTTAWLRFWGWSVGAFPRVGYFIGLFVVLVVFWLSMSGLFKPLILGLGAVSIAVTMFLAARLEVVDKESSPYPRLHVFLLYWVWLIGEIIKANLVVIRACLRVDLDIDPALVKVKTRCRSDLAKTTFANSITLTPGTVTLSVEGEQLLVHALFEDQAAPGAFDEMDERSARAVDGEIASRDRASDVGATP